MDWLKEQYLIRCATPSDINEHLPTLREYAEQCSHVTEFGTRSGNSTVAICNGCPVVRCYDIRFCGIWNDLTGVQGLDFKFYEQDTARGDFSIDDTDMLFIDTLHTEAQLRAELRHLPAVRKFVAFHDTMTYSHNGEMPFTRGLVFPINELIVSGEWEVLHRVHNNNGLTILGRTHRVA